MRRRSQLILLALGLLLSACSGPKVPLSLSMRQVNVDLAGALPPAPPVAPLATLPRLPLPSIPLRALATPMIPPLCPEAGQFAVPELAADPTVHALPAPARYPYRQSGDMSTGGAIPIKLSYFPFGQRAVELGSPAKGYDFAVAEAAPPATQTTAFNLVQPSTAPGATPGGLYIAAMQLDNPVLGKFTFRPVQPLLFFPLPVQQTLPFASAGADPLTQVAVSLRGQVTGKKRVDACGSVIDTWELLVSQVIVTPESELNVEATYHIATQYGGLSVEDTVSVTGTRANALSATPSSNLHGVISQLPKTAG